jgi:hypothetical protein
MWRKPTTNFYLQLRFETLLSKRRIFNEIQDQVISDSVQCDSCTAINFALIKANDVREIAKNSYGKYVYSTQVNFFALLFIGLLDVLDVLA